MTPLLMTGKIRIFRIAFICKFSFKRTIVRRGQDGEAVSLMNTQKESRSEKEAEAFYKYLFVYFFQPSLSLSFFVLPSINNITIYTIL
jgi:hypothetical protein